MKNIMKMVPNASSVIDESFAESRELLYLLVNDQIFAAREQLLRLLNEPSSPAIQDKLEVAFREFYCGYESLAFFLENYESDPLEGVAPHTPLAKKLRRQREYILANRKTTLEQRIHRRAGCYHKDDTIPEKKIAELPPEAYRSLLWRLVNLDLFSIRERFLALLERNALLPELDAVFREFFVAYELLELALEEYYYDPDDGLELRPEVIERLEQSVADIEAGGKTYTLEEVFSRCLNSHYNVQITVSKSEARLPQRRKRFRSHC